MKCELIGVVRHQGFVEVVHPLLKHFECDSAVHQGRVCALQVYEDKEDCELRDIYLPDLFCPIN